MRMRRGNAPPPTSRTRPIKTPSFAELAESVLLQPWFLPRQVAFTILTLIPVGFRQKMRNVFDDYGCLICGSESRYMSNGMCRNCFDITRRKILLSARRHAEPPKRVRLDLELFRQQKLAKKLLSRFAPEVIPSKKRRLSIMRGNPVYEALSAKLEQSWKSK
jgi:hypothetical protein